MNLVDTLSAHGETYEKNLNAATTGRTTFTDLRTIAEHLADMASVLGAAAHVASNDLGGHVEDVVGKGVIAQEVQDARMCLNHVRHLMEAAETLARRTNDLLGDAS
jgi:hypothetical protein